MGNEERKGLGVGVCQKYGPLGAIYNGDPKRYRKFDGPTSMYHLGFKVSIEIHEER